jgi:hypothetical protein
MGGSSSSSAAPGAADSPAPPADAVACRVGSGVGSVVADADSAAVLLGLEELERQQADSEMRRARQRQDEERGRLAAMAASQQQQQHHRGGGGLPPLCPSPHPPGGAPPRPQSAASAAVPSQIHLFEDDEDTTLSAGEAGDRVDKEVLRRSVSIEKLRGSVQVVSFFSFRFRWNSST